ncbi:LuxR family transcriptional regulator [Mucilaginibacter limnophilus]|uniref:LuxR family transcriptional regulator n=1 Tax=Mucilaginibacter limnophilus TaxID=1932778 RepID=A0A3S2Y380_9SPHI|nr:LuxR C-terminal-related transcriptional regulator [Mucilaginibacter limnophilus]RVU00876.1 LuxR family transcriptional regulator [Mucilaginibacter limnophilus]
MNLTETITNKINDFAPYAELMPGVVIIHLVGDFPVVYMSSNGLKLLGVTLEELQQIGTEYYNRYFNIEDIEVFVPKLKALLESDVTDQSVSFFQQVKLAGKNEWTWHMSSVKVFMRDEEGKPLLTITIAFPISEMKHIEAKAERLLEENNFLRRNSKAFSSLSKREKQVLSLVAKGKTSIEIAESLFISSETVQTHRRNIKQKLGINTAFAFTEYALAFDLI